MSCMFCGITARLPAVLCVTALNVRAPTVTGGHCSAFHTPQRSPKALSTEAEQSVLHSRHSGMPPFSLEGVQPRVVDPLPETGLSRNRTQGSIRERELCIVGAGMRRQYTSVSSSEKEGPGDGTAVSQCPAPRQGQ